MYGLCATLGFLVCLADILRLNFDTAADWDANALQYAYMHLVQNLGLDMRGLMTLVFGQILLFSDHPLNRNCEVIVKF